MRNFVYRSNIANYASLLGIETDGAKRSALMKLLVKEEDQFGFGWEQLAIAQKHLADTEDHITRVRELIDQQIRNGENAKREKDLLVVLTELQAKFQAYRQNILDHMQ
jgi:hypothetical protein